MRYSTIYIHVVVEIVHFYTYSTTVPLLYLYVGESYGGRDHIFLIITKWPCDLWEKLAVIVETKEGPRENSNMNMMSRADDDKYEKHRRQLKQTKLRVFSIVVIGFLDHPKAKAILEHPSTKALVNRSKVMASGIHKTLKDAAHHHFDGGKSMHWPSKLRGATMTPKKLRGATTKPLYPLNSVGKARIHVDDEGTPKANEEQKTEANEEQRTMTHDEQKAHVEEGEHIGAHEEPNIMADQREENPCLASLWRESHMTHQAY